MFRQVFLSVFVVFSLHAALNAQEMQRKNGVVSLDGKPILTYEMKRISGEKIFSYCALGEENALFQAHYCGNWTFRQSDDYRHYYFPESGLELILPRRKRFRFKVLLPKMVAEGALDLEGNLDEDMLRKFVARHHVPLPRSFGPLVHRLPIMEEGSKKGHKWEFSPDYDPEENEWRDED